VSNKDLVELAMQLAQQTGSDPAMSLNATAPGADQASEAPGRPQQNPTEPPILAAPDRSFLQPIASTKETRTAEELATMIAADLSQVDGCPKRGLKLSVYGSNPWNAWLSFGADAGPVPNKAELQDFLDIITERLKRRYNVKL
jgi:hypothetical protein